MALKVAGEADHCGVVAQRTAALTILARMKDSENEYVGIRQLVANLVVRYQ